MKRIILATGLALGSLAALAQAPAPAVPEIPPFNCEPKPVYPGIDKIKSEKDIDNLKAMVKKYQDCVKAYVAERNATCKAHTEAGNARGAEGTGVPGGASKRPGNPSQMVENAAPRLYCLFR